MRTLAFVALFWVLAGAILLSAAFALRSPNAPPVRHHRELRQAGAGMVVVAGLIGLFVMLADAERAQPFLFVAAGGALLRYLNGGVIRDKPRPHDCTR